MEEQPPLSKASEIPATPARQGPPAGIPAARLPAFLALSLALVSIALAWWLARAQEPRSDAFAVVSPWTALDWWRYPLERNAFKRLPETPGNLRAIHAAKDGKRLWTVGDGGLILHSADGGTSWARQTWTPRPAPAKKETDTPAPETPQVPETAPSSDTPVQAPKLLGVKETGVPVTVDITFPAKDAFPPGTDLRGLQEKLSQLGFYQGPVDGIASPALQEAVKAFQKSRALPADGVLGPQTLKELEAEAAGRNMRQQAPASPPARKQAPSKAAEPKKASEALPALPALVPEAVAAEAPQQQQQAMPRGAGAAPAEAGKAGEGDRPVSLFAVFFLPDGMNGWAAGGEGIILRTTDGGASWNQERVIEWAGKWWQRSVFFADRDNGWLVAWDGTIHHTTDGGASWGLQQSGTKASLRAVVFADARTGWAAGGLGTIVHTTDGGASWVVQQSGTEAGLASVTFIDTRTGWAAGDDGAILHTTDGGASWASQQSGTKAAFLSVAFADARTGWVAGADGTILHTTDAGISWTPQQSGTQAALNSVVFSGRNTGWAVGSGGAILHTADGGRTWLGGEAPDAAPFVVYVRYPAPWFWLLTVVATAAAGFVAVHSLRRASRVRRRESIVDTGVSDDPIHRADQDRLGFFPIARAVAEFLRNAGTEPPLVLAITAPWGRGKSSMMRLLQGGLEQHGVRCVWFNAWHQQKEDIMLAPLLDAIRQQGFPPLFSRHGLAFRGRLVAARFRSRPWFGVLVAVLLGIGLCHFPPALWRAAVEAGAPAASSATAAAAPSGLLQQVFGRVARTAEGLMRGAVTRLADLAESKPMQDLLALEPGDFAAGLMKSLREEPEEFADLLALSAALLGLYLFAAFFYRAFPERPSTLLASATNRFRLGEAEAQTSFRNRFRVHFADVTAALGPRWLTVFIDDLDRCEAAKSVEVLEAVNYLVSSGSCFVVAGMAREMVEAQVEQVFAGVAEQQRKLGHPYGTTYLRKLIQIEVAVPEFAPDELKQLIQASQEETATRPGRRELLWAAVERLWAGACRVAPRVLLLMLAALLTLGATRALEQHATQRNLKVKAAREALQQKLDRSRTLEREAREFAMAAGEEAEKAGKVSPGLAADVLARVRVLAGQAGEAGARATAAANRIAELGGGKGIAEQAKALGVEAERLEAARQEARAFLGEIRALTGPLSAKSTAQDEQKGEAEKTSATARVAGLSQIRAAEGGGWLVALPLTGLALALVLLLFWRDEYRYHDSPRFLDALEIWKPLLAPDPDRATPREVKRFLNRARYAAARLRGRARGLSPVQALLRRWELKYAGVATEAPELAMGEEKIVALAAVYHARPPGVGLEKALFGDLMFMAEEDGTSVRDFCEQVQDLASRHVRDQGWEAITRDDVATFRNVIREFAEGAAAPPATAAPAEEGRGEAAAASEFVVMGRNGNQGAEGSR